MRLATACCVLLFSVGLAACGPTSISDAPPADEAVGPARTAIGYSSELSLRPGETVEFMVSVLGGGQYEADLVRVVNGDSVSRYADGFEVVDVEASFAGSYDGIEQSLNLGSYVHVGDTAGLDDLDSFTVGAWIFPTFDPVEYSPPDLENVDPFSPPTLNIGASVAEQTVVSRFDKTTQTGWALRLDSEFRLEFIVGNGDGTVSRARIDEPLRDWDWAYVAAAYDAGTGTATVYLQEWPWAPGDQLTARSLSGSGEVGAVPQDGPLRIAAARDGTGAGRATLEKPGDGFNGRIQDVRIADRVLDEAGVNALAGEEVPGELRAAIVAAWDFAQQMLSTVIEDVSGNTLHGDAVNIPDRAVRGRFWDGSTINWNDAPHLYDAITFHADDLYDAQWAADFSYTVPADLDSGVYAARVRHGDFTEYITFFVAAPAGAPRARLAVWMSDYNYLAYSNITLPATVPGNFPGHNLNLVDAAFFAENLEYGTGGVYNQHVDGLYFSYGSRLRPDVMMKPGAILYNFTADTHITAFLEHFGIDYDIITDELVDAEGLELLEQYDAIVSATHPEYVTTGMFDAISDYTNAGGRFLYIGGNGWFWAVDGHPTLAGVMESRNFHDIPERYLRTGVRGGLMAETGRDTAPVFGNVMAAMVFNGSGHYQRLEAADSPRASWIFEGTTEGEAFGEYGIDRVHGGAAGFEIDKFAGAVAPRHALQLATAVDLRPTIEDVKVGQLPLNIAYHPSKTPFAGADLIFFETPDGGAVFSTGSITWIGSTPENGFDNDVARITRNVIERFLDPTPFPEVPSTDVLDVNRLPENPKYDRN